MTWAGLIVVAGTRTGAWVLAGSAQPSGIRQVAGVTALLAVALYCSIALAAEPKRVVLLHSFGQDFKPWSEYAREIRAELVRQSPWPVDITEYSLVTARTGNEKANAFFVQYLGALFAEQAPDLIVSVGAPAAAFVQRHRHDLFANTPMVFTAVDQRRVQPSLLSAHDAVVAVRINYLAALENILRVLPDTKNVTVVVGTSPIEQFWKKEIASEAEPLASRVKLSWIDHLSFEQLLKHAAALPPQSAIFWELMIVDAAGVVHEGNTALARLHKVANAPIFSYDESFFGREIVGGPLLLVADTSRQTAAVAIRILGGEKAGDIKTPPVQFAKPRYDWREMQRWGISEARLPPGSDIFFRDPTVWDQYRYYILAVIGAILVQSGLIMWLLSEHRRRNSAEIAARTMMSELTYLNRISGAGELSASIAHEVSQPLTSIAMSTATALRSIKAGTPNIEKAVAALTRISNESERAREVIANLRSLFRRDTQQKEPVQLNKVILSVLKLMEIELEKDHIEVQMRLDDELPTVIGSEVQLRQVVLNLVMNARDAMRLAPYPRELLIKSERVNPDQVQVSIEDSGPGISVPDLDQIFDPMFTTKPHGMGVGLSICRSIVESHKGRIWAVNGETGSILRFSLPAKE